MHSEIPDLFLFSNECWFFLDRLGRDAINQTLSIGYFHQL